MSSIEIIAEVGVNADGEVGKAIRLIDAAKATGADCVKFQASFLHNEISRRYANGDYDAIAKVLLPHDQLEVAASHAVGIGLPWLCTPAERGSLEWMIRVDCPRIKISSDNITNLPFLRDVGHCGKPIILSTGMSTMEEVAIALHLLMGYLPSSMISVLHCTSAYPCPTEDANLRAITTLRRALPDEMQIGWSDHTKGIYLAPAAVALGATIIEKHLTLDRKAEGPDHASSIEPDEFATMVKMIRWTQAALGDGIKSPRPSESTCIQSSRKSIVASAQIRNGEAFTENNLAVKRPGTGLSPLRFFDLIGQVAPRDYEPDEMIA